MASVEAIPLIVIFVMFVGYMLGMFGYVHSGILYSIAARSYAFETFRNRTNVVYFREQGAGLSAPLHFQNHANRYHAIANPEQNTGTNFIATTREISFGRRQPNAIISDEAHAEQIPQLEIRNQSLGVNPAWLTIGYGICLNSSCGGGG